MRVLIHGNNCNRVIPNNLVAVLSYQKSKHIHYIDFPLTSMGQGITVDFNKLPMSLTVFEKSNGYITPYLTGNLISLNTPLRKVVNGIKVKYTDDTSYFDEMVTCCNKTENDNKIHASIFFEPSTIQMKTITLNYDKFIYDRYAVRFVKQATNDMIRVTKPIKFVEDSKASTITMPVSGRIKIAEGNIFSNVFGTKLVIGNARFRHGCSINCIKNDGTQPLISPFDATLINITDVQHNSNFVLTKLEFKSVYYVPNDYSIEPSLSYLPGITNVNINAYSNPGTDSELFLQQQAGLICDKNTDNLLYNVYIAHKGTFKNNKELLKQFVYKDTPLGEIKGENTVIITANRPIVWFGVNCKYETYVGSGDFIGNFA